MTERKDDNLERIDRALEGLTRADAPERLVQETLNNVRDAKTTAYVPNRFQDQRWASGIAAAVVAVAALGIVFQQVDPFQDAMPSLRPSKNAEVSQSVSFRDGVGNDLSEADNKRLRLAQSPERGAGIDVTRELDAELAGIPALDDGNERLIEEVIVTAERRGENIEAEDRRALKRNGVVGNIGGRLKAPPEAAPATPVPDPVSRRYARRQEPASAVGAEAADKFKSVGHGRSSVVENVVDKVDEEVIEELIVTGAFIRRSNFDTPIPIVVQANGPAEPTSAFGESKTEQNFNFATEPVSSVKPSAELDSTKRLLDYEGSVDDFDGDREDARLAVDDQLATRFLAQYQNLDGLQFQQSTGYWANRYVPGDPAMRRLEAQLRSSYPQALSTTLEHNAQPFDAPGNAALGVYLHATRSAVDGPSRVQLQVGLQAAERQGGLRLPMNVAVVLDLPEMVNVTVAQQVRALLLALNEQRQPDDHFSITVAGVPGGLVVQPDDYRHGTVVSFIDHLVNDQLSGDALDLVDAFVTAVDRLAANDDPDAVLGSSLVLLVTADGIDTQTQDDLVILAHQSAVAGMAVSVVPLAGVNGLELDAIALAGQGRLRALGAPADAAPLIDRELHSASRTVARAIRLRIRLTPGVRLVNVIGSVRLDELEAERVRQAERSIDARLSRNWGIEADRGEDEDGIQIVIPGIAAGASYVVLLDVVVDGPGSVADVRVRYKDLVQMRNGVARASLSLADADSTRYVQGPLERNVLKNLLAFETAEAARRGGRLLANGDTVAARAELTNALTLISGLRQSVAGWENDGELQADEQRLKQFVAELDAGRIDMLVASLEYAAYRKLLPATINED